MCQKSKKIHPMWDFILEVFHEALLSGNMPAISWETTLLQTLITN